jgi:glycosyltransferase involved in cell wall biosynthesis
MKTANLVAVCVCTYKRPAMLSLCLQSLARQTIRDDFEAVIIVVDNDADQSARNVVSKISMSIKTKYHCESRRGIAVARNTAMKLALEAGARWIAFIDDDETADSQWLAELMSPDYRNIPVLKGWQVLVWPDRTPFWALKKEQKKPPEGARCRTAYTNNVRFSTALLTSGLTFDESLRCTGGEDVDFFTRATKSGFVIAQTARAITYELVHPERMTYLRQSYRAYWIAAANFRESIIRQGKFRTYASVIHTIPLNLLIGPILIIGSPLGCIFGLQAFKLVALKGADKISRALGRMVAIAGHKPSPYSTIDGS